MRKYQNITSKVARTRLKTTAGSSYRLIASYAQSTTMRGVRFLRG